MIKRIDLFMPPFSQYGVLNHMTCDIHEALVRAGIDCRLLTAEHDNPKPFLDAIFSNLPDCTFSLNGLLPDSTGRFFCDMIKIPHIACLVDSPNQFAALAQSKRNIITCPDIYATQVFKELKCQNVLFFPHGVNRNLTPDERLEKKYDVTFLGSSIDYKAIENSWKSKYPKRLYEALKQAAEMTLSDQTTPYVEAFVDALNDNIPQSEPLDPNTFHLMQILDELEMYIRGKDRAELIKSIKDAKVHVFGQGKHDNGWKKYIGAQNHNISIHNAVPFEKALEIMKQSKIILNSCPWIKNGGHERIFSGIACGALVITSDNPYMDKHFKDGQDIAYYYHDRLKDVNELVNRYLKDDSLRSSVIEQGIIKVKQGHTWDHRVASLLEQLPPLLEGIQIQHI